MFHLTAIVERCQEALEKDTIDRQEVLSIRDFMYPENEIKYLNLNELTKLRNKNKGFLILSNHNTMLSDYILIRSIVDGYTIAAAEEFSEYAEHISKYHDTVSKKAKLIGYKRAKSDDQTTNGNEVKQQILEKINNGNNIILFPEGKMTHGNVLQPFKKGIFHLAYDNKIPILPLILNYKNEVYFTCHKEIQRINFHMNDDCGIDVNVFKFVYPEDYKTFNEFYEYTFNLINNYYINCKKV